MVRRLLRQGQSDPQIIEEMNLIFGKHCILNQETTSAEHNVNAQVSSIVSKPLAAGTLCYALFRVVRWASRRKG